MVTILASHAADRGSIPGCGSLFSHQTVSGTASAGDAHSLARRINYWLSSLLRSGLLRSGSGLPKRR